MLAAPRRTGNGFSFPIKTVSGRPEPPGAATRAGAPGAWLYTCPDCPGQRRWGRGRSLRFGAMTPKTLAELIARHARAQLKAHDLDPDAVAEPVTVERPRNPEHGDYATNVALKTAKRAGTNPRELAGWLTEALGGEDGIAEATVAGPGFVNIRLAADAQGEIVRQILSEGQRFGALDLYDGQRFNLEFVSANPTGPIHLGGARWAAVGDALGRVFEHAGAEVTREYYFNDHGTQIDRFAASLLAAARGEPTPENGYGGTYIGEIARAVMEKRSGVEELPDEEATEAFRADGVEMMFDHIKSSLHEFGTDFDVFFHENSLFESGAVDRAIQTLKDNGSLYEADGAWWLRSTEHGDDKDRVVIKSDGNAAYIAGDIAYVADKIERGHDLCIYMLGADHHGYVSRLKAAAVALGYRAEQVEVLIGQLVNLVRDGKPVRMSKRAGTVVTLDDLVEAIGVDGARYALIRSSVDVSLDIDLDLWASQSAENPVYYVQYGHARLCSLARKAEGTGIEDVEPDLGLLDGEREGELIRTLGEFPDVVKAAATLREPHRIARFAEALAGAFHRFYDTSPILPRGGEEPGALHAARFALATATRSVLATALGLLGVTAPERM